MLQWYGHPRVLGILIAKTLVKWASLLILLIASWVRVRVTGDAHIGRGLGMGMPETRGSLYHCDSEKRFGFVCTQRKTNVASSPFFTTKCKVFDTIKMYFHIKRFASFCLIFNMRVLQFSPKHTLIHAMDCMVFQTISELTIDTDRYTRHGKSIQICYERKFTTVSLRFFFSLNIFRLFRHLPPTFLAEKFFFFVSYVFSFDSKLTVFNFL